MINLKMNKGITLVALVITIIVLLILVGVTISLVINGGIIGQAQNATEASTRESVREQVQLEIANIVAEGKGAYTKEDVLRELHGRNGITVDGDIIRKDGYEFTLDDKLRLSEGTLVGSGTSTPPEDSSEETEIIGNGTYSKTKGVNTPKLAGLTPIIFDETTGVTSIASNENEWYSYIAQEGATTTEGTSHWANATSGDGSMWVWIPRYTYKIISGEHKSAGAINSTTPKLGAGTIDIRFSKGTTDDTSDGYKLHPAFNFGGNVTGIWVAKFEMSMEENGVAKKPTNAATGNIATSSTIKMVSKPGVNSWRYIQVSNIFTNSLNYDATRQSHMMKNTEWGVVAYLAHSKYGRNGTEVTINNNNQCMTGYGGNTISAALTDNTASANNKWTGKYGKLASTTGNIYGIYDMSGGVSEYVAGYIDNSDVSSNGFNGSMLSANSKYKDVYAVDTPDAEAGNYAANSSKFGDAVYETSDLSTSVYGWFENHGVYPAGNYAVFVRGGNYNVDYRLWSISFPICNWQWC